MNPARRRAEPSALLLWIWRVPALGLLIISLLGLFAFSLVALLFFMAVLFFAEASGLLKEEVRQ